MKRKILSLLLTVAVSILIANNSTAVYPFDSLEKTGSVYLPGSAASTNSTVSQTIGEELISSYGTESAANVLVENYKSDSGLKTSVSSERDVPSQTTSAVFPDSSIPESNTVELEARVNQAIGRSSLDSGIVLDNSAAEGSGFQTALPTETFYAPIDSTDSRWRPVLWQNVSTDSRKEGWPSLCPGYDPHIGSNESWDWISLPDNIIYKAYMACKREPRMGIQFVGTNGLNYWDCTLGGRVSIVRYGNNNPLYPEGLELEIDGAAFPRLTLDEERELWSCDYRFGVPVAFRKGHWEYMVGYYHISSHLGDEKMVRYQSLDRLNYVRDCVMAGIGFHPNLDWRFYFQTEYAAWRDGGARPWHFIFGFDYSPMETFGFHGAPFLAVCGRLREDVDFSGSVSLEAGWQWRSAQSHVFRTGLFYFNGYSDHYQFFDQFEQQIGLGFWYDF